MTAPKSTTKMVSKFAWKAVESRHIRAMLEITYRDGRPDQRAALSKLSNRALPENAAAQLGRPPKESRFTAEITKMLRAEWLPTASNSTIDRIYFTLHDSDADATKKAKIRRIQDHDVTSRFVKNFRKAFVIAHKIKQQVEAKPQQEKELTGPVSLEGTATPQTRPPWRHQVEARERLDQLWKGSQLHGRLVHPTGAGKTDTTVGWLLDQMAKDEDLRVLWLVHQQELVTQAVGTFKSLAAFQDASFRRRARVIHSDASAVSTLAEDELAVAAITYQSFRKLSANKRKALVRFLSRPTIVVVDEAHHAGSPTYVELLDFIATHDQLKGVIGLTATPYPAGTNARRKFGERFPEVIHEETSLSLIRAGVLSRPIVTSVDTNLTMKLTAPELSKAERSDLPNEVLSRLDEPKRNRLVVATWNNRRQHWGKTLLFANNIQHADRLTDLLNRKLPGAAKALHSQTHNRHAPLEWFRARPPSEPTVLVSVGMLTEGVDLPSARTAFLARPTTSPILMRQMVGRVLRGPKAGGEATACVVHFRDDWRNLPDVLDPADITPATPEPLEVGDDWVPGDILTDEALMQRERLARQVARSLERVRLMFNTSDSDPFNDAALDPLLTSSQVVGYYELDTMFLAVFDHQQHAYERLFDDVTTKEHMKGTSFLSYFEDGPPPYPSPGSVARMVELARELGESPTMQTLDLSPRPAELARRILDGDMGEAERRTLLDEAYTDPMVRAKYPTVGALAEKVHQELQRRRGSTPQSDPEERLRLAIDPSKLPKLRRSDRSLDEPTALAIDTAKRLLPAFTEQLRRTPAISWTPRVNGISSLAYWSMNLSGRKKGKAVIRVNRILRAPKKEVPDELLAYLLYHELLHHLLPGQAHDAEFRDYEARWPESELHDLWLDTFHEKWDTRPESYSNDVERPV